ncbi:EAL domain-containing protein [Actimicrobium antarcticum]|uniref:PAS domain S-box-containing protein/diguanylate cyclase (GGDEF) domain-containing protein n=1 Tax=Actimicrobium antarcticum TaxID=1051899 RepID=A0ABP7TJL1_9BURK
MFKRTSLFLTLLITVVVTLTTITVISISVMSVLRAYVGAESLWSKAQKDATSALTSYASSGRESDLALFREKLRVTAGFRRARLEMNLATHDDAVVRQGFLDGGVHADDIPGMVWVYRNFKWLPDIARAVAFWETADAILAQLEPVSQSVQDGYRDRQSMTSVEVTISEIARINKSLTPLEEGFSNAIEDASRLIRNLLMVGVTSVALLLMGSSVIVLRRISIRGDRLEAQLRQSEERMIMGFRGSGAGLWDWDIQRNAVYYSPWITELLGYAEGTMNILPSAFIELMHPDDREQSRVALALHFKTSSRYDIEFRLKTSDGNYLWCRSRAQATRAADGAPIRMVGTLVDISDLKAAEAQAFSDKELAQVALAAIGEAVITTDTEGRITYCNQVAEALLGQRLIVLRNQPLASVCRLVHEEVHQEITDLVGPAMRGDTGIAAKSTLLLHCLAGRVIPVTHSVASIRNFSGKIIGAVVVLHDVSEGRRHAAELSHQANHDALTGVLNRRAFERQLNALIQETSVAGGSNTAANRTADKPYAVMYLDLDQFKVVNDTCGHAAGDALICQVSMILQQSVRDGDLVARLGGDEFGIVLKNCHNERAQRIAEILRQGIADIRFAWGNQHFAVGVSVGLVVATQGSSTLKEIMKAADAACYMAKEKGRNRVHVYSEDDEELSIRHTEMTWVARIKNALERDRFCLYAQAIVPLQAATADTSGTGHDHVEILLRMLDDDGKIIAPMAFIPAAERYGLMPQIDRWVIRNTFRMLAEKQSQPGTPMTTCAINLSGASIDDDQFLEYALEQQRLHGVAWSVVCFEITETAAIANLSKAAGLITRLRELGCSFALDDFGAGMSSFSYLKHLPVDYLKIDGSFVKDMLTDVTDRAMVDAINQIGHVMGKKTIAEFVENDAIRECLREMGVDFAQGYGVGRPEPVVMSALWHDRRKAQAT